MRVRLLGTGGSQGWPNPWCDCSSCRAALLSGAVRAQTAALVDDRLLLEAGSDAPRSAARLGLTLAGVRAVLVTHAHADHHSPQVWRWRERAVRQGPLTVLAPPAVLVAAGPLPTGVTAVAARAGDEHEVAGYAVRVLPAHHRGPDVGPAVLYDLTGPGDHRLLWATDTGPLSEAALGQVTGREYHAVLLDLTGAGDGHHDLGSWPLQVAELRRRGAVTPRTALVAVHLGHANPPPDELAALLARWQARAGSDGDVLDLGAPPSVPGPAPRVLVLGAASSGKSAYAERLLAAEPQVTYVATAPDRAGDTEWAERVDRHRRRRPAGWTTVETADVAGQLRRAVSAVLVDDLGLWLTRVLEETGGWSGPDPTAARRADLVAAWRDCPGPAVLVAPEVGAGVVPGTASGRRFRDLLGELTADLATGSDEVVQVVAGLPRRLR